MSEIIVNLGELQNSCFVVMPFDPLYQSEYEKIINPALVDLGITCIRGDEIYTKQRIMDDIWISIRSCRFVIAELTGRNPNVLYEVGLAHAIGKPVIILTRNSEDVPFDLKDLRYLYYDTNNPFWGENLKVALKELIAKVIENANIETYLDGISKSIKTEFPTIQNNRNAIPNVKHIDISGTWIGSFDVIDNHEIIMEISQNVNELFATAAITFSYGNEHSVVQQNMTGSIENEKILLTGVNYTFVKRGEADNYDMDSFELLFNKTNKTLIGNVIDNKNALGTIKLKKKE